MKCTCCGKEISANDRYCPYCGQNNLEYVEPEPEPKPAITKSEWSNAAPQANYQSPVSQSPNPQVVYVKTESAALSILALVFGILGGWLGLVLGIIGLCTNKESGNRTRCGLAIGFWVFWLVIYIIVACTARR